MGILYLKEHTSCYNYSKYIQEGFLCYRFSEIETEEEFNGGDCILFVIEGEVDLSCNGEHLRLSSGYMICLSRGSVCKILSCNKGCIIIAQFDHAVQSCEKESFSILYNMKIEHNKRIHPLAVKDRLHLFLRLLICYLEDGANCIHFHETKLRELFWSIRFYYTKAEQAAFFYPILSNNHDFKKKVLNNYRKARTVKELAWLCECSLSSFKRKFLNEFREPASEWLQKQMNNMIKYKLANGDMPIGIIAEELHFSSLPQFCRYCKRCFGYTPGEWRKVLKNRNKTSDNAPQKGLSRQKG